MHNENTVTVVNAGVYQNAFCLILHSFMAFWWFKSFCPCKTEAL